MTGHIGLCVVYLVDEPSELLFYKHIEQIRRCSYGVHFQIYAGVNRLAPKYVEHLREFDFVRLCKLVPTTLRNSDEHAHYLDQLVSIALADGASHIATLDVDSFPVDPAWLQKSEALLRNGAALVGVLRTENGDVAAPHPSFMFFPRQLQERFSPTFARMAGTSRAEAFLRGTRQPRLDTGAGYGIVLAEQQLPWARLLRANRLNDHALMGGIYGRFIYHFGGGSREKVFVQDVAEARSRRPGATVADVWAEIAARNEEIATRMLRHIESDFDGYVRRLLLGA